MVRPGGMEPTMYEELPPAAGSKPSLTLNLGAGRTRRSRLAAPLLSSPDFLQLKIATPELEKLILQNGVISTPTPGPLFLPQTPTEEQEQYAKPFMEALDKLHAGPVYTELGVKEEPQCVPSAASSPPLSPIDLDSQERIKLERKRQRNRVAASKCRRLKLERISKLEDKVKVLKSENAELAVMVLKLKEHVARLKEDVMEHYHHGCHIDASLF